MLCTLMPGPGSTQTVSQMPSGLPLSVRAQAKAMLLGRGLGEAVEGAGSEGREV